MLSIKKLLTKILEFLTVETIELSVTSDFDLYDTSNDSKIIMKRTGFICEVSGQVKPKSTITGSTTAFKICTIPSGYRPARTVQKIQQGSGNAEWLGAVRGSDGAVNFSRYRDTANASGAFKNCDTSQWLAFHFIWIVGE
jgi:hypothetical protein